MSEADKIEKVRKLVVEQLGLKDEEVKLDLKLVDDLGADSLDHIELIMALEDQFECEIPDEEAEKATTVRELAELLPA